MTDYKSMNKKARKGGCVVFGSSFMKNIPFGELAPDYEMDSPVYNRSIDSLNIDDAPTYLDMCVYALKPAKVFIALGDVEAEECSTDEKHFIEKYGWLLYTLHSSCRAKLYIVSVMSDTPKAYQMNEELKKLAGQSGIDFIDCRAALHNENTEEKVFDIMRFYMRSRPISFAQAFAI